MFVLFNNKILDKKCEHIVNIGEKLFKQNPVFVAKILNISIIAFFTGVLMTRYLVFFVYKSGVLHYNKI